MATGSVSIAARLLELQIIGSALFVFNVIAYVVVSVLTLTRIRRPTFPRDLMMYDRAVGSFTAIAGTCILGSQFVIFGVSTVVATGLFAVGGCLWLVLVYAVFTGLSVRDVDKPIDEAIDGSWLLLVVATQSVAVLSGLLAPVYPSVIQELLFAALMLFLAGGMFYLILITLVFYRMMFFPVDPGAASPTYWINTGAVAITTLAGARLVAGAEYWVVLAELRPFFLGFTLFYWTAGTWWIPLLITVGIWRHTVGGFALPHTLEGYDPDYWGLVFPLGMYTASTFRLVEVTALDGIRIIAQYFVYVAVFAWIAVGVGLVRCAIARLSITNR